MQKKQQTLAIFALGAAVVYLAVKNGGVDALRRDAYQANKALNERTGGRVPLNRNLLPDHPRDSGFGVTYQLPGWLTGLGQMPSAGSYQPSAGYTGAPVNNDNAQQPPTAGVQFRSPFL